jgi:ABC-2 type transport system ATP-binding protein
MREHCDKGNTVFFSSHILEVVEKICDRVGIIDKGRLVAVGTIEELKSRGDSSLEEFFLKLTSGEGNE